MDLAELVAEGIAAIERIVHEGIEESHRLDFKTKRFPDRLDLDKDDRRALGEAGSGFANAEGGLLIIGVQTETYQGIDRAKNLVPVDNVASVADRYKSYLSECVSPPVDGVKVASLAYDDGTGFILISIPQGDKRPHLSTAPGHHRFYRRTSDRFHQMERYEIAEMFGLLSKPKLELVFDYSSGGLIGDCPLSNLYFGLKNTSQTIAKFPYLSIDSINHGPMVSEYGLDGNGNTPWPRIPSRYSHEVVFSGGAHAVIHPEQVILISCFKYLHYERQPTGIWSASALAWGQKFSAALSFGCENFELQRREASFSEAALLYHQQPSIKTVTPAD